MLMAAARADSFPAVVPEPGHDTLYGTLPISDGAPSAPRAQRLVPTERGPTWSQRMTETLQVALVRDLP